jgi:hypothetical protein
MIWWRIYYKNQQGIQGDRAETWDRTILSSEAGNSGTEPVKDRRQFVRYSFIENIWRHDDA